MSEQTDEQLMLAYAAGEDGAFRELFRRYAPMLMRLLRRHVGRPADVQDLVQQTFLQVHRARRDFRRDLRLRPWIMTIALNLARDLLRRRGRRPESSVEVTGLPLSVAVKPTVETTSHVSKRVRAALHDLPQEQRLVIELHWFDELSFEEIASVVGATSGAARVRAHRGYAALRKALGPEEKQAARP